MFVYACVEKGRKFTRMEVRNNTPSFGMAFIKPKAGEISSFTEYVTKGRRPRLVARGLAQVQKAHAADKYTDIHYLPDAKGFSVIPKTGLGLDTRAIVEGALGGTSRPVYPGVSSPTRLSKVQEKFEQEMEMLEKANASKLKTVYVGVKSILNAFKEAARVVLFAPKDTLPATLRVASAEATRVEKEVTQELAKRAAREQRRIANERLIDKALK